MTVATITLSSKGQIVIPKEIRDELHWEAGAELELISTPTGLTMRSKKPKGKLDLADLRGILQHEGPPLPIEELCKPVELTEEESRKHRK